MDFVSKRAWFFLVSGLLILPGIISLVIPPSLTPGIDFTSGSALEVTFVKGTDVNEDAVRNVLNEQGHSEALIQ